MTAEVAVMNRYAVALAADSAVTINGSQGNKIYNAANKLFALSKREPVGIMVYGNAEFMGVPWETIIKVYRAELGSRSFLTLVEYYDDFMEFLGSNDDMFGEEAQIRYVEDMARGMFQRLRDQLRARVDAVTKASPVTGVSPEDVAKLQSAAINEAHQTFAKQKLAKGLDVAHEKAVSATYRQAINKIMAEVFERLPLTRSDRNRLRQYIVFALTRDVFPAGASGVVVAGFGRKEHFPKLHSSTVQARVANRLKMRTYATADVARDRTAVIPFAQTDAVQHFMEGIDPRHALQATKLVKKALDGLKDDALGSLDLSDEDRKAASLAWDKMVSERLREFSETAVASRNATYVRPLMEVISILPKDELAAVAEALVNITSLRRKMSMGEETVGGPIDVAVISKGDGLIWMKRKHYFKPELNPHFIENYFRAIPAEEQNGKDA
ncbi:MAG TPA: hypothetical protein VIP11_02235 [Gemmatimonadaceae bacterium]